MGDPDTNGDTRFLGFLPAEFDDPKDWVDALNTWSDLTGAISAAASLLGLVLVETGPPGAVLLTIGRVTAAASTVFDGASVVASGMGYGWRSAEFHTELGDFVLGLASGGFGKTGSKIYKKMIPGKKGEIISKQIGSSITEAVEYVAGSVLDRIV